LEVWSEIMVLAEIEKDKSKALERLKASIDSGKALDKFKEIISSQGGEPRVLDDYSLLPKANFELEVRAQADGFIKQIDAIRLGLVSMKLGAGRQKKDDIIDPAVGIWIYKKVSDKVTKGECIAKILANDKEKLTWAADETKAAFEFSSKPIARRKVIWAKITKSGIAEL